MSENIRQIAMRVKELRESCGESAEEAASGLGMSLDKYLAYESGEADISISFITEVASRYNVESTVLLTGEDPKLRIYSLVRKGQGTYVERFSEYKYESLAEVFAQKKAQPFLVTVDPKAPETPISLNSHPGQEFDYVMEGKLEISINGHLMVLSEGDCIYFDSSFSHGMKSVGDKPTKFLAFVMPV